MFMQSMLRVGRLLPSVCCRPRFHTPLIRALSNSLEKSSENSDPLVVEAEQIEIEIAPTVKKLLDQQVFTDKLCHSIALVSIQITVLTLFKGIKAKRLLHSR